MEFLYHQTENQSHGQEIAKLQSGKTIITITQKSLNHVLERHSLEHQSEKAKEQNKTTFLGSKNEIKDLIIHLVSELSDQLERERKNRIGLFDPYIPMQKISHHTLGKIIVQLKKEGRNQFVLISAYPKKA